MEGVAASRSCSEPGWEEAAIASREQGVLKPGRLIVEPLCQMCSCRYCIAFSLSTRRWGGGKVFGAARNNPLGRQPGPWAVGAGGETLPGRICPARAGLLRKSHLHLNLAFPSATCGACAQQHRSALPALGRKPPSPPPRPISKGHFQTQVRIYSGISFFWQPIGSQHFPTASL